MVENKHVHAPDTMESVLQEIELGYVAGKFKEEKVDIGVAMSATEKDLIKLGDRTIFRRRYYDTTNNNTDGCGSYSYTTTTNNTTSSMKTLGREERSFLFFPRTYGNNGHRSSSSRRTSSSTTTRKNAQKKSQVLKLGQSNSCACLTELLIKFQIQHKNKFCKRQGLD